MKSLRTSNGAIGLAAIGILCAMAQFVGTAQTTEPLNPFAAAVAGKTEDKIAATAKTDPKLNTTFFRKTETSFPWHIVVNDDGSLEDTTDGSIDADDLVRIEHAANCVSTHQGEHMMAFSEAVAREDGVELRIFGGLPAYTGQLTVSLDSKGSYTCGFTAAYKAPTSALAWRIKKKELRLKSDKMKPGTRLYGWISVEFEETDDAAKTPRTYKIEGYFKPVIQSAPGNIL